MKKIFLLYKADAVKFVSIIMNFIRVRNSRHRMRDDEESCLHFFTVRALLNAPFCGDKVFTEKR